MGTGDPNQPCPNCGHPRRVHSKNGCEDFDMNKQKECPCKRKYMDF